MKLIKDPKWEYLIIATIVIHVIASGLKTDGVKLPFVQGVLTGFFVIDLVVTLVAMKSRFWEYPSRSIV